jgi:anti-sigma regulatory factor (Ser/Thr protein kinase)
VTDSIGKLTFDLAGDICLALQSGSLRVSDLPSSHTDALGPLLELRHVRPDAVVDQNWLTTSPYTALLSNLGSRAWWYEPELGWQGFVKITRLQTDSLAWTDFMIRAKRAAKDVGFSNDYAAKLVAAIGEFYSNVVDHSKQMGTGYIVFCARNGAFEFVVADSGIGVLNSLRSSPNYVDLGNAGTALELALSDGVTRHTKPGHGNGFRPLFIGLANISRLVRFRSDDHSRELIRADGGIDSLTRQVSSLTGFFCYVLCEVDGKKHM